VQAEDMTLGLAGVAGGILPALRRRAWRTLGSATCVIETSSNASSKRPCSRSEGPLKNLRMNRHRGLSAWRAAALVLSKPRVGAVASKVANDGNSTRFIGPFEYLRKQDHARYSAIAGRRRTLATGHLSAIFWAPRFHIYGPRSDLPLRLAWQTIADGPFSRRSSEKRVPATQQQATIP